MAHYTTSSSMSFQASNCVQPQHEESAQLPANNMDKDDIIAELQRQLEKAQRDLRARERSVTTLRRSLNETRDTAARHWSSFVRASWYIEESKRWEETPLSDLVLCGICQMYMHAEDLDFEPEFHSCDRDGCTRSSVPICSTCVEAGNVGRHEITCSSCLSFR